MLGARRRLHRLYDSAYRVKHGHGSTAGQYIKLLESWRNSESTPRVILDAISDEIVRARKIIFMDTCLREERKKLVNSEDELLRGAFIMMEVWERCDRKELSIRSKKAPKDNAE